MTYSIVACDPATGDLGVAVQSKFLAVGAVVPWARAGVGAVATQAFAERPLRAGRPGAPRPAARPPTEVAARAGRPTTAMREPPPGGHRRRPRRRRDPHRPAVASRGRAAGPGRGSPPRATSWPGAGVVDGLADTFLAGGRPLPELLVACLAAADAAGGDRRGRESAALLVVRAGGGYGGGNDRWIDLRVDHHDDPIGELARLVDLHRLYFDRPDADRTRAARRGDGRGAPGGSRVARRRAGRQLRRGLRVDVGRGRRGGGAPAFGRGAATRCRELGCAVAACARRLDGRQEPGGTVGGDGLDRSAGPRRPARGGRLTCQTGSDGTPQPGRRPGRDERPRPGRPAHARGDRDRHRHAERWPGSPTSWPPATGRSS